MGPPALVLSCLTFPSKGGFESPTRHTKITVFNLLFLLTNAGKGLRSGELALCFAHTQLTGDPKTLGSQRTVCSLRVLQLHP